MFDYLQKYNSLPREVRNKLSASDVISSLNLLEQKYNVNLASTVMKVAILDVNIFELALYLRNEFNLDQNASEQLAEDLISNVFYGIVGYLGVEGKLSVKPKKNLEINTTKEPEITKRDSDLPVFKPSFFFSLEDEKEIKDLTEKYSEYTKSSSFDSRAEERINTIIEKVNLNFGSEVLAERFRKIIKTYIRGIRDRIETKQALIKPFTAGGLGFDNESSEKILLIADGDIKDNQQDLNIQPPKKIIVPEDMEKPESGKIAKEKLDELKNAGVRDMEYDLKSLAKIKLSERLDTEHELAPPPPGITPVRSAVDAVIKKSADDKKTAQVEKAQDSKQREMKKIVVESAADKGPKKPAAPEWPQPSIKQMDGSRRIPIKRKILIEDIKYEPKIMSPIDELRYMNLINFRRLDSNPFAATEKILNKINLLDDEYSKRVEGIKAWRVSPVNRIYLKIGEESINSKKSIGETIQERKAAGQDYLSDQEIEAIIELNKKLRF